MRGIEMPTGEIAGEIQRRCYEQKLIIETAGPNDEILKLLPTLTISDDDLVAGLSVVASTIDAVLSMETWRELSSRAS